jgi:Zn-finger nucleic acid-binding protein
MRTYERNGILIDQCEECRGIFLDRGELDQLLDAEWGHDRRDERHEDRYTRSWPPPR